MLHIRHVNFTSIHHASYWTLDASWIDLRSFPCVKDSYLHERSRIVMCLKKICRDLNVWCFFFFFLTGSQKGCCFVFLNRQNKNRGMNFSSSTVYSPSVWELFNVHAKNIFVRVVHLCVIARGSPYDRLFRCGSMRLDLLFERPSARVSALIWDGLLCSSWGVIAMFISAGLVSLAVSSSGKSSMYFSSAKSVHGWVVDSIVCRSSWRTLRSRWWGHKVVVGIAGSPDRE